MAASCAWHCVGQSVSSAWTLHIDSLLLALNSTDRQSVWLMLGTSLRVIRRIIKLPLRVHSASTLMYLLDLKILRWVHNCDALTRILILYRILSLIHI